jgi:hypothetical protein
VFICEWCSKLSPSWATGQCVDCQKLKSPPTRSLAASKAVFAFVVSMAWTAIMFVRDSVAAYELFGPGVALFGLLPALGVVVMTLMVVARHPAAPRLVQVGMTVLLMLNAFVWVTNPQRFQLNALGPMLFNGGLALTWLAWFTTSGEVKRLFVRSKGVGVTQLTDE